MMFFFGYPVRIDDDATGGQKERHLDPEVFWKYAWGRYGLAATARNEYNA